MMKDIKTNNNNENKNNKNKNNEREKNGQFYLNDTFPFDSLSSNQGVIIWLLSDSLFEPFQFRTSLQLSYFRSIFCFILLL